MSNRFHVVSAVEGCDKIVEDRIAVLQFAAGVLLVVADGAGGTGCGGLAAEAVLAHAGQWMRQTQAPENPTTWAKCLKAADEALFSGGSGGETTGAIVSLTFGGIAGASVGDSAVWLITRQSYADLTRHQRRKPLIGSGEALPVPFTGPPLQGSLLIATDGLVKYAPPDRICHAVLTSGREDVLQRLIGLVRLRSGSLQDDVGVIVCEPM